MHRTWRRLQRLGRRGQAMVGYVLLACAVTVAGAPAWRQLGEHIVRVVNTVSKALGGS